MLFITSTQSVNRYQFSVINVSFVFTEAVLVKSGLKGLRVLKTTQSAFVDFVQDEYTTLADAPERIFR